DHVLPQSPPGARERGALLRDAEPDRRDRRVPRYPADLVRAPAVHVRVAGCAGRAAHAEPRPDGVRRRVAGRRLPRGRPRVRAASSRGLRGGVVRSGLYTGTVMHARVTPAENVFRYSVCFYLLELDELPALDRQLALFGWNRPNVVTYRDSDHLDVRSLVDADRYLLLTNLRVLGYVFNPVSFWYCYRAGELTTIVAETSNTFGEKLPYVLERDSDTGRFTATHDKKLHDSPCFPLDQEYSWWFSEPGDELSVRVDLSENGSRPFWATLNG